MFVRPWQNPWLSAVADSPVLTPPLCKPHLFDPFTSHFITFEISKILEEEKFVVRSRQDILHELYKISR